MKSHALRDGFQILWAILREGFSYRSWRLFHQRKKDGIAARRQSVS